MMLVDYAGSIFPIIAHAPWNGIHLADFVMPFFLFVAGISVAIAYKECNISSHGQLPETSPSWCHTPFDPEGTFSCCDLRYWTPVRSHLIQLQGHKERLWNWFIFSVLLMSLGLLLCFLGIPLNKSLYTISYLMVTTSTAGTTFCLLYALVNVYDWRCSTCVLEWIGKHSLNIFILVTSNIVVITAQGFYLNAPQNNIVHWIITRFVHK